MISPKPDIGFIPTEQVVVDRMLELAEVTADDLVYDLGCGDGRIVIAAVQRFGCRGVGIDIDPVRIQEARDQAEQLGLGDRIEFRQQNLFECDFRQATVVMLYLLPHLNLRLRPQLFRQLQPGSRIVSHDFDMETWTPDRVIQMHLPEEEPRLYRWTIPVAALAGIREAF